MRVMCSFCLEYGISPKFSWFPGNLSNSAVRKENHNTQFSFTPDFIKTYISTNYACRHIQYGAIKSAAKQIQYHVPLSSDQSTATKT